MKVTTARTASFGPYALDLRSGELRKFGTKVKMGEQPFQILLILLERPGEMVTREELRARLWADDTFVDFDHGLNSAVQRLRDCLSDSAGKPRWIETLPRRGYRFIGQVEWADEGLSAEVLPQPGNGRKQKLDDRAISSAALKPSENLGKRRALRSRFVWLVAALLVLLLTATLIARHIQQTRSANQAMLVKSLAVLPLENLSGDPAQEYFADGMTDELITALAKNHSLRIVSRTSAMQFKGVRRPVRDIARELGVDGILEGSITRSGSRVHLTVQLIHAPTDTHIWAESYDRDFSEAFSLPSELSQTIAKEVRIAVSPPAPQRHINPDAHDAYLRGLYFQNQFTVVGYGKAITYFQQAIDLDPNFAEAYSGLAECYHFLVVTDSMSTAEGESKALDAARKAVAFGENLAESHSALAGVMMGLYDWPGSEAEYKRAVELNPSYSVGHRIYAALLVTLGRHQEAWEQINEAMRTDPLSLPNNAEVVRTLYYARNYDRAIEQANKALQLDPDYYRIHFWLARVYAQKGMHPEAIAESEKVLHAMPDSSVGLTELAYSLAAAGRQSEAQRILHRLQEKSRHAFVPAYNFAIIHTALHQKDRALQNLQKAYDEKDWALMVLAVEPRLDPLRSDPRFQELVRKVGLRPQS